MPINIIVALEHPAFLFKGVQCWLENFRVSIKMWQSFSKYGGKDRTCHGPVCPSCHTFPWPGVHWRTFFIDVDTSAQCDTMIVVVFSLVRFGHLGVAWCHRTRQWLQVQLLINVLQVSGVLAADRTAACIQ